MPPPNRTPASNTPAILLTVARTHVRDGLIVMTVLLLVASTVVKSMNVAWGNDYIFGLLRVLWVDEEGNLPTWFSSTLLLSSSVLAFLIGVARRYQRLPHAGWLVLAGLVLGLSIDESASIHEISTRYAKGAGGLGLFPEDGATFAWVVYALPLIIIGGWFGARFLRTLDAPVRNRLGIGLVVWMTGVFGIEALTGQLVGLQTRTWTYLVLATLEEGAEMIGAIVFIDGLLVQLSNHVGSVALQFANLGAPGVTDAGDTASRATIV